MVNKVTLIGRLGKDPETRHLENGAVVSKFSIATTERYTTKDGNRQENTEWHDIVCWRKLAELSERLLKKGKLVYVEGKLTHRKYDDKNGITRYITEVAANTFQILERLESDGGNSNSGYFPSSRDESTVNTNTTNTGNVAPTNTPVVNNEAIKEEMPDMPDDDLPF